MESPKNMQQEESDATEAFRNLPWVITDREMITLYCGVIAQTGAGKVLDIGMFMKRIGAVSRSFQEFALPEDAQLYGVDLVGGRQPVYRTIYRQITDAENYRRDFEAEHFELGCILEISGLVDRRAYRDIWKWTAERVRYILTEDEEMVRGLKDVRIADFQIGQRTYYIAGF